jgi:acetolactate synthase-1/2/3 large subunit
VYEAAVIHYAEMAAPASVAHAFARALRSAGVQRVYGLPGEDHLRLLDALPGEGLRYIGAREESAAALMAATEAQASGLPGVALVTIAPGITNAVNAIAHAWLDHVPLLVVCGQHAPERAPVIVRQGLDNHRLVDSITKWTVTASARVHQVLARALEVAMAPPAGPVLLELRDDVAAMAPLDQLADWPLLQAEGRTFRPVGEVALAPEIQQLVSAAAAPTIIVGGACPTDAATRLAVGDASQRLKAPVFCSPSALGMLGPDDAWFAGTFLNGNLERALLSRGDLIITLGLDAKDFFNAAWRYSAPLIAINPQADTQRFVPTRHQLIGDTATSLAALAGDGGASAWRTLDISGYRASVAQPFHLHDDAFSIPAALRLARSVLPGDSLVAVDAGFGKPLTSYLWSAPAPNRYFSAHGLSTMGYALPAANALQLAYPHVPVVAFMGDGSLLMRASELSVAAEHGIAPIMVAWMDGALAQIETKQLRQGLAPVGGRLPALDCARIADAFGAVGVDVHTLADFGVAVGAALTRHAPTLIGAHVDQSHRAEWYELLRG